MEYLYLLIGFVLLFVGGKYLVKGSVEFAAHLKVSTLVIGVTVVSFATSAPELAVSLMAAINNQPDISIGNVVGSNIANIAFILALTAIIIPIPVSRNSVTFDWPFMMLASILFYVFILNLKLQFYEGLLFVASLTIFSYWSIHKSRKKRNLNNDLKKPEISLFLSIVFLVLSAVSLVFGSKYFTLGAEQIARNIGVSERVISVSLIAVGTSIPELVTSLMAAIKKEMDISFGNIIGSNIFNLLGILGISSMIKTIPINVLTLKIDVLWMLGISFLLFLAIFPVKKGRFTRIEGIIFLTIYIFYIYLIYKRG